MILLKLSTNRIYFTFNLIKLCFEFILSNSEKKFLLPDQRFTDGQQHTWLDVEQPLLGHLVLSVELIFPKIVFVLLDCSDLTTF